MYIFPVLIPNMDNIKEKEDSWQFGELFKLLVVAHSYQHAKIKEKKYSFIRLVICESITSKRTEKMHVTSLPLDCCRRLNKSNYN